MCGIEKCKKGRKLMLVSALSTKKNWKIRVEDMGTREPPSSFFFLLYLYFIVYQFLINLFKHPIDNLYAINL